MGSDKEVPGIASSPLKLSKEVASQASYSLFASAQDRWNVDEGSERCTYWHTETGCCFEWHQSVGILLQYAEKQENGNHAKFPIWSLDCPEENAWIWDSLPLPPTDPASEQSIEEEEHRPDPVSDCSTAELQGTSGTSEASSSGAPLAVADAIATMLPPPVPLKKKKAEPKDNEVLDDNIWEKRCRTRERREAESTPESSATESSPSSSSSLVGPEEASNGATPSSVGKEVSGQLETMPI